MFPGDMKVLSAPPSLSRRRFLELASLGGLGLAGALLTPARAGEPRLAANAPTANETLPRQQDDAPTLVNGWLLRESDR
ncbi:MAG: twin-arginine translocation signal domain-containing protein [Halomonas sp.]|nr:twin-arginine translocation signal domain-containing protein [Halomonas sp.]